MRYEATVANVSKILKEYTIKLTLRQIYYRLVAAFGLPNKRSSYNQLSRHLVKAREKGHISERRIEDRTRGFIGEVLTYSDPDNFTQIVHGYIERVYKEFFLNLWEDQDMFILIWVEKDALSRVIADVAKKYRVIVAPSRGYASFTYIRRAVFKLPRDKKVIVLHFVDHDPSGLDMTRDLEERLWRYGAKNLSVERVALTYDQVQEYNLMPNPTKMADPRSPAYIAEYGMECWELDAIDPRTLQKLVLSAIEERVEDQTWQKSEDREEEQRSEVEETIEKWIKAIDEAEEKED